MSKVDRNRPTTSTRRVGWDLTRSGTTMVLLGIAGLALLIRLLFVLVVPQPENQVGDSVEFDLLARNLLAGHGLSYEEPWLPSARRMPLYPLLLAGAYWLFGLGHYRPLLLLQAVADASVAVLVAWLAWQAWADRRSALLGGLAWAFYLPAAQLAGRLLADSLFTTLLVAGVSTSVVTGGCLVAGRRCWLPALLAGVLLGLALLARPTALPVPLLLVVLLAVVKVADRRRLVAAIAVLLAGFVLVLAPWVGRNYRAFHQFMPGSTLVGFNFYQTHFRLDRPDYTDLPGVRATNVALKAALRAEGIEPTALNEVELYDEAMRLGLEQVQRHPERFLRLVALRVIQLWFNLGFTTHPSRATLLFAAANAALLLLALLAEVRRLRRQPVIKGRTRAGDMVGRASGRRQQQSPVDLRPNGQGSPRDCWQRWPGSWAFVQAAAILILLYFTAGHAVIIAAGRYIIPAMPFLIVLAAGVAAGTPPDQEARST